MIQAKPEIWKDLPKWEGLYQVSSLGRVRSLPRTVRVNYFGMKKRTKQLKGKILEQNSKDTYRHVSLCRNGREYFYSVHILVLLTFVGPKPKGCMARHFPDRNTHNNCASNLSWATPKQNAADKMHHGTEQKGQKNGNSKLTPKDVRLIRKLYVRGKITQKQLAEQFGVGQPHISSIVLGDAWS